MSETAEELRAARDSDVVWFKRWIVNRLRDRGPASIGRLLDEANDAMHEAKWSLIDDGEVTWDSEFALHLAQPPHEIAEETE